MAARKSASALRPKPVKSAAPSKAAPHRAHALGVSVARNRDLEAMIDHDPADPTGYLVYGDWLQQQGDRRGELIVIQAQRHHDPDDERLADEEERFLRQHERALLGELAKVAFIRTTYKTMRAFGWRYGFIRAARVRRVSRAPLADVVRLLLEHPSGRFLERLVVGRTSFGEHDETLAPLLAILARKAPVTFQELVLGDEQEELGDLSGVWTKLPRLRHLTLLCPPRKLGEVRAEALTSLALTLRAWSSLEPFVRAPLRALRRLDVTVSVTSGVEGVDLLSPLESRRGLPNLAALHVRQWAVDGRQRLVPRDRTAARAAAIAITRGLMHLRLDVPLSDVGVEALLDRSRAFAGRTLELATDGVEEGNRRRLTAAFPKLVWRETTFDIEAAVVDRS